MRDRKYPSGFFSYFCVRIAFVVNYVTKELNVNETCKNVGKFDGCNLLICDFGFLHNMSLIRKIK